MRKAFGQRALPALLALTTSLVFLVSGCGNASTGNSSSNNTQSSSTSNNTQSSTTSKKAQYVIKIASPSSKSDSNVMAYYHFQQEVEKKSNGRIKVEVFPNGQLGTQKSYIQQLESGNLQIGEVTAPLMSPIVPGFGVFSLPYIAKSMDQERKVIQSGLGNQLNQQLEKKTNLMVLAYLVRSPRSVYSSVKPIYKPSDLKGLKIRVMQGPIMVQTFKLLGADPVAIPANQRYTALQTHVVGAAENSPPVIVTQKEYEVTKYLSLTRHFITPNLMVMDKTFFDKLPQNLQKIVLTAGEDASNYEFKVEKKQLNSAISTLKSKGMKVNNIDSVAAFRKVVQPIYKEYQNKIGQNYINDFLQSK